MKKFIFIVGDGKRCGKDYVFQKIAENINGNSSVCKVTLAENVFKILKDLKVLEKSDLENKTFEYRDYMGYLGQKWNNLHRERTKKGNDILLASFLSRKNPNQSDEERMSNFTLIDEYMRFYKEYLLKTEGYNLWSELADYYNISMPIRTFGTIFVITDMRQMREYEYFNLKYLDAEKFVILVNSNSKKVDMSVEAGNSGLFSQISYMPDMDISRVELNNHKLNKLITDSFHVYNSVNESGEYENKWEDDLKNKLNCWFK